MQKDDEDCIEDTDEGVNVNMKNTQVTQKSEQLQDKGKATLRDQYMQSMNDRLIEHH